MGRADRGNQDRWAERAAGGLQCVEQSCASVAELDEVRKRIAVAVAADESIRRAADPARVALAGAADVACSSGSPTLPGR